MDYEKLYKSANNLGLVMQNVATLESYGFNCKDLLSDTNKLQNSINSFNDIPNYIPLYSTQKINKSNFAYAKSFTKEELEEKLQSERMMNILLDRTTSLLGFTNKLVSYFKIYETTSEIQNLINKRKPSENEIISIIKTLSIDLETFYKTKEFSTSCNLNINVLNVLYYFIKEEFRLSGTSSLLQKLQDLDLDNLKEMAIIDANKLNDSHDIKRLLDSNNESTLKELIFYISINEADYKDEVINKLSEKKKEYENSNKSYEEYLKLKKDKSSTKKHKVKAVHKAKRQLLYSIMPYVLSLTIFATSGYLCIENNRRSTTQTVEFYDQYNGEYTRTGSELLLREINNKSTIMKKDSAKKGEVIVTKYSRVYQDGTRDIVKYSLPNTLDNIEEYAELDLSSVEPIYEGTHTYNYDYKDEYTEVGIVLDTKSNIDINTIMENVVIILLAGVLDLLIGFPLMTSKDLHTITIALIEAIYYESLISVLEDDIIYATNNLKSAIKKYNTYDDGTIYDNKELKRKKEQLDKAKKEYNELLNKYDFLSDILKDNGFERQLKRS